MTRTRDIPRFPSCYRLNLSHTCSGFPLGPSSSSHLSPVTHFRSQGLPARVQVVDGQERCVCVVERRWGMYWRDGGLIEKWCRKGCPESTCWTNMVLIEWNLCIHFVGFRHSVSSFLYSKSDGSTENPFGFGYSFHSLNHSFRNSSISVLLCSYEETEDIKEFTSISVLVLLLLPAKVLCSLWVCCGNELFCSLVGLWRQWTWAQLSYRK